jgi:signal transduction histidine kinase
MLCKEFVEKHNGSITVDSVENKGSTFTIVLPQNEIGSQTRH